jgi:hypothetical protein
MHGGNAVFDVAALHALEWEIGVARVVEHFRRDLAEDPQLAVIDKRNQRLVGVALCCREVQRRP